MDPQRGVRYPDIHVDQRVRYSRRGSSLMLPSKAPHLCDYGPYRQLLHAAYHHVDVQHWHHLQAQTYHEQGLPHLD